MQLSYLVLALIATTGLSAQLSQAQRAPIVPLAPSAVTVRLVPAEVQRTVSIRIVDVPSIIRIPSPLYLFNSKIIIGTGTLSEIYPRDIAKVNVYKEDKMPANWRTIPNNGVVDILLKKRVRVPSQSLASLKRQAHLSGPVQFAVDGQLLPNASLRVAISAIFWLEVQPAGASGLPVRLNILLTKMLPTDNPPGTIMIRGAASR